jgi:hypothetical protein
MHYIIWNKVNPPKFGIYISNVDMRLGGIVWFLPIDKILAGRRSRCSLAQVSVHGTDTNLGAAWSFQARLMAAMVNLGRRSVGLDFRLQAAA